MKKIQNVLSLMQCMCMTTKRIKCCVCGEDVILKKNDIPTTWLASYQGDEINKVIHVECSRKPEFRNWWR